jgi:6-phosphofructokinase 1
VIAVAEGAGQDLLKASGEERTFPATSSSGRRPIPAREIESYFKAERIPLAMRYFDPSYRFEPSRELRRRAAL